MTSLTRTNLSDEFEGAGASPSGSKSESTQNLSSAISSKLEYTPSVTFNAHKVQSSPVPVPNVTTNAGSEVSPLGGERINTPPATTPTNDKHQPGPPFSVASVGSEPKVRKDVHTCIDDYVDEILKKERAFSDTLEKMARDLRAEKRDLSNEVTRLKEVYSKLEGNYDNLNIYLQKLEYERWPLEDRNKELNTENVQLKAENEKLHGWKDMVIQKLSEMGFRQMASESAEED